MIPTGVAGFIFYGFVVASLILFMSGHALPATVVIVLVLGLPLLAMAFKEPLTASIRRRRKQSWMAA